MPSDARARVALAAALALVALTAVPAAVAPLWDADVWWVLRAGEDLIRARAVPTHNRYGFTAPAHPWVMHEWGFGALYAALASKSLGRLALVRVLAVSATAAALAWRSLRDARPWVAALCVALALTVFGGRFESPRPVGMTYPLAAALAAVAFDARFTRWHAALTTAMVLAWANLHGSFPLGLVMLALGLGAHSGDRRARLAALLAGAAATALNPYGLHLHALALRYALGEGGDATAVVHARIVEWWPLWRAPLRLASPGELLVGAGLVALWGASLRDARWRARAVMGLLLSAMALRHGRHLQLAGVVGLALAAGPLEALVARGAWSPRDAPRWGAAAFGLVPLVVGATLWVAVARGRTEGAWADATLQDEAAGELLGAMPAGARVFVELPFAGYAVWWGASVYFDPRNDCYPADVLREALDLNDGLLPPDAALRTLRARGATHALVRCRSRAARALAGAARVGERAGLCAYRLSGR
jgi:hypothetical protein